jgi:hypothetical protein
MKHDRSAAMFARIGSYGKFVVILLKYLRTSWDAPVAYRREAHFMRGPGPKSREKQAAQRESGQR